MDNKKLVPQIRFKGFHDEWKEKDFKDITFLVREKNKNNVPYESYSVTNENGFIPQSQNFTNSNNLQNANKRLYNIVTQYSFAYNPARINVGSIGYYNGNKTIIVSSLYEVFKTNKMTDDIFLWIWFKSDKFKKYILQYQEGGVRLYFYYDKLCLCNIIIPTLNEQKKISKLFENIDTLISKKQIKLEKVKALKQTLLKKMFPSENSDVPEIRFKGFTEKWEKKKLGDYIYESDKTNSNNSMSIYDVLSVSKKYGLINQIEFKGRSYAGSSLKDYKIVDINDIVYTKSPLKDTPFGIIKVNTNTKGIVSTLYAVYKSKQGIFPYYIDVYFSYDNRINKFLISLVKIGAKNSMNISNKSILNETISLPKYKEQCKIADYFYKLDNLINLYEKEIEKLQKLKKAFFGKMFV